MGMMISRHRMLREKRLKLEATPPPEIIASVGSAPHVGSVTTAKPVAPAPSPAPAFDALTAEQLAQLEAATAPSAPSPGGSGHKRR